MQKRIAILGSTGSIGTQALEVISNHKEAFEIADNILVLNDGKIQQTGNVEQIKNSDNEFVKYFIEY